MKWLLLAIIRGYKRLPNSLKRQCLFKEHCSSFVERATKEGGFGAGLKALRSRIRLCRPGYSVYFDNQSRDWRVSLADGSINDGSVLADFVLRSYREVLPNSCAPFPAGSNAAKRHGSSKVLLP